ncbi:MAG: site-2 protease family protein [Zetaproteobacteria bacterium CG06_land_8_20_14_3_00_59_53]|nr:MAG: site-2 protease family protein [Zetaproteobacteria bacterium CG2_30_59_37]PIO90426.1 MAG: site-2 protease family protein [Zetaproteobacteria bacterium CG23_combo_of_CG06-09_8_20_14_all_59_86]PIU71377.1 MAG: site-2 protease family protein [Zetaproteobacteria bacterium CG06_land_8_20_14_3_00_59_53]HCS13952.1 site-2 protease family protein [Zetaproteobacteria bacterium]
MDINAILHGISIWALPVMLAIVLHEVAHGWMADKLGDDTARWMGRLTLNPIKHIDPIGTILVPAMLLVFGSPILFGYAKPVPVNFRKLRHPKRDMVWVALAGPVTNVLLAIASAALLALMVQLPEDMVWLAQPVASMCQASIIINMVLCIFNLIPLPPLDGGRVAVGLLPGRLAYYVSRIEPYGFIIIVALLFMGVLQQIIGGPVMGSANFLINAAMGTG